LLASASGAHVLAVMPTGAGKSLCYQVPALARGGLAIVVSPLVALMQDQVAALKLAGVAAETINSSADREANVAVWKRVAAGDVRILYLSPERLMTERMIGCLQRLEVSLIAVDEVHCMSQWGAAFRPEYDALKSVARGLSRCAHRRFHRHGRRSDPRDISQAVRRRGAHVRGWALTGPTSGSRSRPKNNSKSQLLEFCEAACRAKAALSMPCRARAEELGGVPVLQRVQGRGLSCRTIRRGGGPRQPEPVHDRQRASLSVPPSLWHGHRQAGCALCLSRRPAAAIWMPITRRSGARGAMANRPRHTWCSACRTSRCAALH
jgi:hypothetical protein